MPTRDDNVGISRQSSLLFFGSGLIGAFVLPWLMYIALFADFPSWLLFAVWMLAGLKLFKWSPAAAKSAFAGITVGLFLILVILSFWLEARGLWD